MYEDWLTQSSAEWSLHCHQKKHEIS